MKQAPPQPLGSTSFLLGQAFQHAAVGMSVLDLDCTFIEVNDAYCRILGRTAAQLRRTKALNLTHSEDRLATRKLLKPLVAGTSPGFIMEKRYVRPDKSVVWTRNSVSALRDEEGRPTRLVCICEDISGRRQAEETLRKTEPLAVVGRLASSIAHEINDPLEAVINLLYLARATRDLNENQIYLQMAEKEIGRVSEITKQNLLFHRQQTKPSAASLAELLESILLLHRGKFSREKIKLHVVAKDSPRVICFPGEIRQVFANLIGNAVDAMVSRPQISSPAADFANWNSGNPNPSARRINIRIRPATHYGNSEPGVRVTIADTGSGIQPSALARIYEPFFTTKGEEGTGLGLWVTSEIMQRHGASLRVRSSTVAGRTGTVFALTFPLTGAAGGASQAKSSAA